MSRHPPDLQSALPRKPARGDPPGAMDPWARRLSGATDPGRWFMPRARTRIRRHIRARALPLRSGWSRSARMCCIDCRAGEPFLEASKPASRAVLTAHHHPGVRDGVRHGTWRANRSSRARRSRDAGGASGR
jgi:hypothetical protein